MLSNIINSLQALAGNQWDHFPWLADLHHRSLVVYNAGFYNGLQWHHIPLLGSLSFDADLSGLLHTNIPRWTLVRDGRL